MTIDYSNYLKVPQLLSLQQPVSDPPEHDETLFIVIHQVYELWFKEILHEADRLVTLLGEDRLAGASHTLGRMRTIFKVLVAQMDVLETMTPNEFVSFRERLTSASGFQSAQFRELEILMGHVQAKALPIFPADSQEGRRLAARIAGPKLWDAFVAFVDRRGLTVPPRVLNRDVTGPVHPSPEMQQLIVRIYEEDDALADFCELLTDLDEGIMEWRYRHVQMVQRTIGNQMGTGGSSGVEYLKSTLFKPFFPDLWAFRTQVKKPER